jgi:hypothetical protein
MTPRWERTRRFAEPHAMLVVDTLFTILWLSAFATQASYNARNQCGKVCNISGAIVGLGVFEMLLWVASSAVSAYTVQYYNHNGTLPGYDSREIRGGGGDIDPDKAAFSMAPHDDEAYERVNMDDQEAGGAGASAYGGAGNPYSGERYGHVNPYATEEDDDPSRYGALPPRNDALFDSETDYNGSGAGAGAGGYGHGRTSPRYEDGPAQFPDADYDRIHR